MTDTPRKSMLSAGLGRNADATKFQIDKVEEILAIEMKKLSEAGFDCEHITLDPKDIPDSISRLKEKISSRDWDLFEVGFAVRGMVDSTEIFEKAVNTWVEAKPGKLLIFPKGPHDIASAPIRMFGKAN